MFGFVSRPLLAINLAGMCVAVTLSARSHQELDSVRRAQALIEALFPDLKGERLWVQTSFSVGFDSPWTAADSLQITIEAPGLASEPASSRTLLRALMHFNRGEYYSASFEGELIASEALDRIEAKGQKATDWQLEHVVLALASEKARFGPNAEMEFERVIALDRWRARARIPVGRSFRLACAV